MSDGSYLGYVNVVPLSISVERSAFVFHPGTISTMTPLLKPIISAIHPATTKKTGISKTVLTMRSFVLLALLLACQLPGKAGAEAKTSKKHGTLPFEPMRPPPGNEHVRRKPKKTISASVSIPGSYTAMEGDIEVNFKLDKPNAFEYNAIVYLEYLPGDAVLPHESHHSSKAKRLTSLPVPIGIQEGTVVFQCGAIKHAGPHRAFLSVNGNRVAESEILQVAWPPMAVTVPTRLETFATDVSVTVSFTRSLCTTFTVYGDWGTGSSPFFGRRNSKLGFATSLDLVECSSNTSSPEAQDCQAPTAPEDKRLWLSLPIDNLYRKSSLTLQLNCSVWGQSGTFRLFLRTNLSHASVVTRSAAILVKDNPGYAVRSEESQYVFPCLRNDIKPFSVIRPKCASDRDKLRVYGQGMHSH